MQIHGKYGTIEKGTCFGEDALLFDENVQTESVIASKPSQDTGTIVVYRLAGSIFDEWIGPDEKKKLQTQIKDIQLVVNVLSGVDTKIDKGTIIKPYEPDGLWLWKQWSGTVGEVTFLFLTLARHSHKISLCHITFFLH